VPNRARPAGAHTLAEQIRQGGDIRGREREREREREKHGTLGKLDLIKASRDNALSHAAILPLITFSSDH